MQKVKCDLRRLSETGHQTVRPFRITFYTTRHEIEFDVIVKYSPIARNTNGTAETARYFEGNFGCGKQNFVSITTFHFA